MMYQFQRSFIKAASEFVAVRGPSPQEEPHARGCHPPCPAASPPCSQAVSWPGEQGWSWGRLLLGGDRRRRRRRERRWCRGWRWLCPSAAVKLHPSVWGAHCCFRCLGHVSFSAQGKGLCWQQGIFLWQPVDMAVGCQEGPVVRGHGSAGLLQQLPRSTMDPSTLRSTRCSSLACRGTLNAAVCLCSLCWNHCACSQPCPAHHAVHMASALSSLLQPIKCLPLEAAGWS